jgi:hypothetical protein
MIDNYHENHLSEVLVRLTARTLDSPLLRALGVVSFRSIEANESVYQTVSSDCVAVVDLNCAGRELGGYCVIRGIGSSRRCPRRV